MLLLLLEKVFEQKTGGTNRPVNVSVYSFDGRPGVRSILEGQTSSNDPEVLKSSISAALENCEQRKLCFDKSTNLNGGIVDGLKQLAEISRSGSEKLRARQFIVFTDGKDRAERVNLGQMYQMVDRYS